MSAETYPFSQNAVYSVLRQLLTSLLVFHNREVPYMHRDVSPDNCMVVAYDENDDQTLQVILSDFDVVRESNFGTSIDHTARVGKNSYWAPEVVQPPYGTLIDVWSLGVVIIELMTLTPRIAQKIGPLEFRHADLRNMISVSYLITC
jgi:serine/threonine protein kinase